MYFKYLNQGEMKPSLYNGWFLVVPDTLFKESFHMSSWQPYWCSKTIKLQPCYGRCGGLMVSALDSGASVPGSSPGRGHCVVFLGKTLNSHGVSLHPGV